MSDTNDQNTPKDDFSQSNDDISSGEDITASLDAQSNDLNEENQVLPGGAPLKKGELADSSQPPRYDLNTLLGCLEKKLADINDTLWEKEGMQMQYVLKQGIREEYYRRWKGEANSFVVLATRLQKRIVRERARLKKVG